VLTWRFHDEATAEFDEAVDYYLSEASRKISFNFVTAFHSKLDRLCCMPRSAPSWPSHPDIRHLFMQSFPYSIVYALEHGEIMILAVAHSSREPGYWLGRLR
jgi:plasmid stabilization system protein ParE